MTLEALELAATAWLAQDPDPQTRAQTQHMLDEHDHAALQSCFGSRLGFGTAGIRGKRGPGPGRLNRLVARQVAAGVARVLLSDHGDAADRGVVIGFDGRHGSRDCAKDIACVLAGFHLQVYLFDEVVPTPVLAHATTHLGCVAGVMVTASHNPPQDNGIKVYWDEGAQIIPPLDSRISQEILLAAADKILVPHPDALRAARRIRPVPPGQLDAYQHAVLNLRVHKDTGARAVYTAMHGVGWKTLERVLDAAGHRPLIPVPQQRDPDGDFPTVKLPNPEEAGALDLARALGTQHEVDLILANDPDADRLAVAVPDPAGGWRVLSGNQIGLLLAEDLLTHRRASSTEPTPLVATTIVSSSLLQDIAAAHGAACAEVLTGFKWLARAALDWPGAFVLGFEEALGYSVGPVVRDKDGISAALIMLDLASWLKRQGRTLLDALDDLDRRYGVALSSQRSLVLPGTEGQAVMAKKLSALRSAPPKRMGGLRVLRIRDVQAGTITDVATGAVTPLDLPTSNVLAFDLQHGGRVLARPSGTEPKLKLYFEARTKVEDGEDLQVARDRAAEVLGRLEEDVWELIQALG